MMSCVVVDTGSIHHFIEYWMPTHYDMIEDEQNKTAHLSFSNILPSKDRLIRPRFLNDLAPWFSEIIMLF